MMSLTKLGLTPDSLIRTFFAIFLCFDEPVVGVLGSDIFAPIGVKPKGGIFPSDVFVQTGVNSKGGQLFELFWCSNSLFPLQI